MGSCTQSGSLTSRSRINAHRVLRSADVTACSSPLATAASIAATSLSWPGKSTSGQGESSGASMAFMGRFYPSVRGLRRIALQGVEETADRGAEALDVDQERVMALWRRKR